MHKPKLDHQNRKTIGQDCRPSGTSCKQYTKVVLQDRAVAFINKKGDNTFLDLFGNDATCLLGLDSSGLALAKEQQ